MNTASTLGSTLKLALARLISPIRGRIARALNARGSLYCPVCKNNVRRFLPFGTHRRAGKCPICGSLPRHRADWVFLTTQTDLFDQRHKHMLHVAPEEFLSVRFRAIQNLDYLSGDLSSPKAMVQMDITDIRYPDDSFQVIYCSHVLEHVANDVKALAEFYRVLCPDGWALLQVPTSGERTFEDPSITTPEERTRHFGRWDHVRRCGTDYAERMTAAGFQTQVVRASELATLADCTRMAFQPNIVFFFCRKPLPGAALRQAPMSA
jgi:SAM-dependent methyltransferase